MQASARLLAVSILSLTTACGAGAFHAPPRTAIALTAADRAARLAEGANDPDLAADPATEVARLRRIAAIGRRLGNHGSAASAIDRAVAIARAARVLAPPGERGEAQARWSAVRAEALAIAEEGGDLELALWAIGDDDPGGDALGVVERVARATADGGGGLEMEVRARTWAAASRGLRLDLERLGALPHGERGLSPEELAAEGPRAWGVLHARLSSAAGRDDRAEVLRIARALASVEPWDLTGRAIVALERSGHADLAIDVVGTAPGNRRGVAIARLERAHRAEPGDAAIAIALAARALHQDLIGDALELAIEAERTARDADERASARMIAAVARLGAGDVASYDAWEREAGAQRSVARAWRLAQLEGGEWASEAVRARAGEARRVLVALGAGESWSMRVRTAIDPAATAAERDTAYDAVWAVDRPAARVIARCAREQLDHEACEERLSWLDEERWWEEGAPEVAAIPELDDASIPPFALAAADDAQLAALAAWAVHVEGTPASIAPAFVESMIVLEARRGELAAARARLERDGALLRASRRVVLRAWLADLETGRRVGAWDLERAWALGNVLDRFALPLGGQVPDGEGEDPSAITVQLARAASALRDENDPRAAITILEPLLDGDLPAAERAVLGGFAAVAADRVADLATLRASQERVRALAPGSAIDVLLEAALREHEGDPPAARAALERFLARRPDHAGAQVRWLVALGTIDPEAPAGPARETLIAIDPDLGRAVREADVALARDLPGFYGTRAFELVDASALFQLGPRGARAPGAWPAIVRFVRARVLDAPDAAQAIDAAREIVAFVDAAPPSAIRRRWEVRLRALLADRAGALEAADAPADGEDPGDLPLIFDDTLRLIAAARDGLDDDLAWRLIRAESAREPDAAAVARLESRAGSADPAVQALACSQITAVEGRAADAVDACARAYRASPDPVTATRLSWAVLEAPLRARARGLDPAVFFAEARRALGDRVPGVVLHNLAVLLADRGDAEEAAQTELEAQARGHVPGEDLGAGDLAQIRWRGVGVRAQYARTSEAEWAELAFLALADARIEAAALYADAAVAGAHGHDRDDLAARAFAARDAVAWARADLAAGRADAAAIMEISEARRTDFRSASVDELAAEHPESALIGFAAMLRAIRRDDHEAALRWAEVVGRDAPRPTLALSIAPVLGALRGRAEAEALRARAAEAFPDDPRLAPSEAGPVSLPVELASAEALERVLAGIDLGPWLRGADRRALVEGGVDAIFPEHMRPMRPGWATDGELRVGALSEPRQSDCDPSTCLDAMVPALERSGFTRVWQGDAHLPIGAGARALLANDRQVVAIAAVPLGARVFVSIAIGPPERLADDLGTLALIERTMRPIDAVVGAAGAEAIRGDLRAVPAEIRAGARDHALSGTGTACPIAAELALLPAAPARAALIRDAFLATPVAEARARVLSCAEATGSGALGIAAALDPDPAAHRRGLELVAADPAGALEAARAFVRAPITIAASGSTRDETSLPPLGAVEVLAALPEAQRRTLGSEMLHGADRRLALLALAAEQVRPGVLDPEAVQRTIETGDPVLAVDAVSAHWMGATAGDVAAMRARLDALRAPLDRAQRELAGTIVHALARQVDARDRARLDAAPALLRTGASEEDRDAADAVADNAEHMARAHEAALRPPPRPGAPEPRGREARIAATAEWIRSARGAHPTSPEAARMLATEPLARFLPGAHWRYVRAAQPSLLIATLRASYERIDSAGSTEAAMARSAIAWMAERGGAALLGPDGGIDLDRPIECAIADRYPRSWVCAAYVRDADRVRGVLARRGFGTNSGVWLALQAADLARTIPIVAGATPIALDRMLADDDEDGEDGEAGGGGQEPGSLLFAERARTTVDLDGVALERYATFHRRENDGAAVDTEHYLFTGDRLLVFGLEEMARAVLARPPPVSRTLAGDARFRRLTEEWADGAALQMASVGWRGERSDLPLVEQRDASFEIAIEGTGLVLHMRSPYDQAPHDVSPLVRMLPPDATARFALGSNAQGDEDPPAAPEGEREPFRGPGDVARFLTGSADRIALAWTPRAGDAEVWARWIVIGEGPRLDAAIAARGIPTPEPGAIAEHAGVRFARRGARWVVGPSEEDVRAALARPDTASAGEIEVGEGRLDGVAAARAMIGLGGALPEGDPRRTTLQMFASLVGVGRELSFDAHVDPRRRQLVVVAHVAPTLRPEGTDAIIDEVLRNPRNAIRLPRAIDPGELRAPLRLIVEVDDAEAVATRVFSTRARSSTRVVAPRRVEVIVSPGPALTGDVPDAALEGSMRTRLTSGGGSEAARVRQVASDVVPSGASPSESADAIVRWVHEHVRYELTTEELDATSVIARGRGDCSELSRLTVALLRAAGVPAEVREGFAIDGQEAVAHAWVAFHDGRGFREIDPTAGRTDVSAGYLPASVWSAVGLLSVGGLRVVEVGPAPRP